MRKINKILRHNPQGNHQLITNSLIKDFLKCKQRAYLALNQRNNTPTESERHQQRIAQHIMDGFATTHKNNIIQDYNVSDLRSCDILHLTRASYLIAPLFTSGNSYIALDAIKVFPPDSETPPYSYVPVMATAEVRASRDDRLTLCMIVLLLENLAPKLTCSHRAIISEWGGTTTFSLKTHIRTARRYLRQLNAMIDEPVQPRFYKNPHCKSCHNKALCMDQLTSKDDLSLLGSMNPAQIERLNSRGILTINQLSYTFRSPKVKNAATGPARPNHALKALALRENCTYILEPPSFPDRRLEIFVDCEGFPDERCVYLIGMIIREREQHREIKKSFWADSLSDTDTVMTSFLNELKDIDDYIIYHFGSFETRALRRFAKRATNAVVKQVEKVLSNSLNILSLLSNNVYPPTYTNDLKTVAARLGFAWSDKDVSGPESIVIRQKWELEGVENHKSTLIRYNLDDCAALKITKDWLADIAKRITEGCDDLRRASDVQQTSYHKWGAPRFELEELDAINKYSYFDYQRSKVYLRTNKVVKRALQKERKSKARINEIDKRIGVPEQCPNCGGNRIRPASAIRRRRQILDLRFMKNGVKKWVVEVNGKHFRCMICGDVFEFPMYGRNLLVWAINQHVTYRIGISRVGEMLLENYNIDVPRYKLNYLKGDLVAEYRDTAAEILQGMVRGPLIQIDETSAVVRDSPSSYVWVFASMDSVYYLYRPSREAGFLHEVLERFDGVLVSDFYSGYDSLPCKHQKCLIHLIRDLNADLRKDQFNIELRSIVERFGVLLRSIVGAIDKYGLRKRHLRKHEKDVDRFFCALYEVEYETDIAAHYQRRLTRYREKLFEFLKHDGIPWNNNNPENAIKPFAKYREMAGHLGTRKGLEEYLVLLSIQQTCKYRGINFLDFLKSGRKNLEI